MKKTIKIAHLYYDLMNLYGESGNVKALKKFIERQGIDVEIHFLTIDDKIDFKKYDFFYLGAGSEENEYIVLSELNKYRDEIKEAIEDGVMFLVTGNALELFGKKLNLKNGKSIDCLNTFSFNAIEADERIIGELFYKCHELEKNNTVVGFKNCSFNLVNKDYEKLFDSSDNIHYKNFYGMMFVGPVLIRNPYFTDHILKTLFEQHGLTYRIDDNSIEYVAYKKYIENFVINDNLD